MTIRANIVDLIHGHVHAGTVTVEGGRVVKIVSESAEEDASLAYLLPGFIDAHVHIESSMLVPSEFARLAVVHGTVATVSDPHEIANVCGLEGVEYMIGNGRSVNFKFHWGAPSCVPATRFETAGAALDASAIETLIQDPHIGYLSEMMNFPGVISGDEEVMRKIAAAHRAGKPVDGHAPGLRGDALRKYQAAGISTDHECFTAEEAQEKLALGMKVLIREGSAAKNFEALIGLLNEHADDMMFCSDDKHPDSLVRGHINQLCKRAIARGIDVFKVLKAACVNPVKHYHLNVGLLQPNDPADFILVTNLHDLGIIQTYINGVCVAENGKSLIGRQPVLSINHFKCGPVSSADLTCPASKCLRSGKLPVMEALDGQLITNKLTHVPEIKNNFVVSDVQKDILKIVVINRYGPAPIAKGFIKNFGLKQGAIASSVAHDSHNIIAVGADDESIADAVNLIVAEQGGVSCVNGADKRILPLPVAGLMSDQDGHAVAAAYTDVDAMAKSLGSSLSAPFMTLSFMALLVIPALKLSDKGLFDGEVFEFV